MRVLLSTITYYPTVGGADDYARSIAEGVASRGHEVLVVSSDLAQHVKGERLRDTAPCEIGGVRVVRGRSFLPPGHVYPVWPSFFRHVREFRPDVVHGFGLGYWSVDAVGLVSPRLPVLISPTGGRYRSGRLYGLLRRTLLRRVRQVPLWTALSESERKSLQVEYEPDVPAIELLPPTIVTTEWQALRPDPFPDLPRGGRVLFAGRLSKDKGVPDLLEAFDRVRRNRRASLILTGPDYGLGTAFPDHVRYAGTLDRETLLAAYQHCDLLALPSYHEGFGIVLLEAMAAGKPVVAYDNSSLPELCRDGENGITVKTGDREALASALERLLDDEALSRRLGAAGQARAFSQFNREGMIDRVLDLYARVRARDR